jgi:hypothetical protein
MPTPYQRNLNQIATYFPPGQPDGFGGVAFGVPIAIKCRWQNKADVFRNPQGDELTSSAVVYVDRLLEPKGALILGDLTGEETPFDVSGASFIGNIGRSPSLNAATELIKAWLHGSTTLTIEGAEIAPSLDFSVTTNSGYIALLEDI